MAGRRISFDQPAPDKNCVSTDGVVLAYEHVDSERKKYTYRFSRFAVPSIGADLARLWGPRMAEEHGGMSSSTVEAHYHSWGRFCSILAARSAGSGRKIKGLGSLTRKDIDAFDVKGGHGQLLMVINTLRRVEELSPGTLGDGARQRLRYVSSHKAKTSTPRDAFSAFVEQQLLEKADLKVAAARDRVRDGRRLAEELRRSPNPTEAEAAFLGGVSGRRFPNGMSRHIKQLWVARYGRPWPDGEPAGTVCLRSFDDASAFLYAIGLRVMMPVECLKGLRRDCLKDAAGGTVEVEYKKARGASTEFPQVLNERVRDGGISTPGGLIRLALDLTQPAADYMKAQGDPDADKLWIGAMQSRSDVYRAISFEINRLHCFVRASNIIGDDGEPLRSAPPSRMRKTVKSASYKRLGGHLRRFADDNSPAIADRHYADIPAHQDLHEQAVEDGVRQLHAAMHAAPKVIASEDEARARSEGITAVGAVVSPEVCSEILDGKRDLWLSSCSNFWASPFGTNADGTCASPFDDCIHCRNSVFTVRKLPGLLSYLEWIEDRRSILTESAWTAAHGASYVRITTQILPQFEEAVVEAARCLTVGNAPAFYLPLQQRSS